MTNRAKKILLVGLACGLCAGLCGCDAQLDDSILNAQADYSIDIALPYPTVTPPPAFQEEAQALVIDAEGSVTVNDSETILQDGSTASDATSNYKSLRQGNTGLAVQALQSRLKELGYFAPDVSGIFDADTEAAVRRFEQTYGTMQTGVATAELQARLFSPTALTYASEAYNDAVVSQYKVLQRGDVGSSVYALQQRLKNLGYPITSLSGIYDNETANAIMLFYEAYGLTASDVANVALQKEIYSDSARYYGDTSAITTDASMDPLEGKDLERAYRLLYKLGYLTEEADGDTEQQAKTAVKLFEEAYGQLPSGMLNERILDMLESKNAPEFSVLSAQYTNLLEGSSGEAVQRLQARLVELGFAVGTPNGNYGSATTASIKLFQAANGLDQSGVASLYTQAVLYSSFALNIDGETAISAGSTVGSNTALTSGRLMVGSSGDAVLKLQNRLTELGYVCSVTGNFDNLTSRAISYLQAAIGCNPDGVASVELQAFLQSSAAPNSSTRYHKRVQNFRILQAGDSGDDVEDLQKQLWELGFLKKKDIKDSVGSFNEATGNALRALQTELGYESPDATASIELQCYLHSDFVSALDDN